MFTCSLSYSYFFEYVHPCFLYLPVRSFLAFQGLAPPKGTGSVTITDRGRVRVRVRVQPPSRHQGPNPLPLPLPVALAHQGLPPPSQLSLIYRYATDFLDVRF